MTQNLIDAINLIDKAMRAGNLAVGPDAVWKIAYHAKMHLDKQLADELRAA